MLSYIIPQKKSLVNIKSGLLFGNLWLILLIGQLVHMQIITIILQRIILCFCFLPLVIRSCLTVIPLRLTIRIITIPLTAGMPDKVFSAAHTSQNAALRKHIVHIDIHRRSNIRNHTGKGIPRNVKYAMYLCNHFCFMCFWILLNTHFEIREHFEQIKHAVIVVCMNEPITLEKEAS